MGTRRNATTRRDTTDYADRDITERPPLPDARRPACQLPGERDDIGDHGTVVLSGRCGAYA